MLYAWECKDNYLSDDDAKSAYYSYNKNNPTLTFFNNTTEKKISLLLLHDPIALPGCTTFVTPPVTPGYSI